MKSSQNSDQSAPKNYKKWWKNRWRALSTIIISIIRKTSNQIRKWMWKPCSMGTVPSILRPPLMTPTTPKSKNTSKKLSERMKEWDCCGNSSWRRISNTILTDARHIVSHWREILQLMYVWGGSTLPSSVLFGLRPWFICLWHAPSTETQGRLELRKNSADCRQVGLIWLRKFLVKYLNWYFFEK